MAAIAGKLSFDPRETLAQTTLEQMIDAASRNGHTARRVYAAPGIALAGSHAIADAERPERGAASGLHVFLDGHITNSTSLRRELDELGRSGPNHSDECLIALAFAAWGDECLDRFEGPFACAVWDERRRRLLLARDRAGIRPMYYALLHGHGFVFASSLVALLQEPGVTRDWCPAGVDAYLTLGYIPAPLSPFRRVSKLEPSQFVVVEGRRLHAGQYASPTMCGESRSADEAAEELASQLADVTRHDSRSAVLFSGGVCSGALLAACQPATRTALTIAWHQASRDVARAHAAATHLGCEAEIEVCDADPGALAAVVAASIEEPIADPAALNFYAVCASASLQAGNAMTAHGAATLLSTNGAEPLWDHRRRRRLYTKEFAADVRDAQPEQRSRTVVSAFRNRVADVWLTLRAASVLADSTFALAQQAAFASGMRLQFPFATRPILELAAAVRGGGGGSEAPRPILSRLLEGRLPSSLMPAGFETPHAPVWMRGTLAALVPSMLLAHRFDARGIASRATVQELWDEHSRGLHDHSLRLWALLMLELWCRHVVDDDAVSEPVPFTVLKVA